jgi:HK97 family phage prohead protease
METLLRKAYKSEIQDIDDKGVIIVAANAFGNKDSHGDISMKGSFTKTIQENFNRVRWYLNHHPGQLLGVPIEAHETEDFLVVKGQINLNKTIGRDTYEDYKMYASHGKSLEHSVAVKPIKKDASGRVFEWKWKEYSTLTEWASNPHTPLLSLKSENNLPEIIEFLEECTRKANYSDEKGKEIEKQITTLKALIAEPEASTLKQEPLTFTNLKFY